MAENQVKSNKAVSPLTVAVIFIVVIVAVIGTVVTLFYPNFIFTLLPGGSTFVLGGAIYDVIYVVLTLVTDALYLLGGGIVSFGAVLVLVRFVQAKLKDPNQQTFSTRTLSGYLNLSLNIFIGAEIVRTVVVGTAEIWLLLLVIASRGLFSLILYAERRWHGTTESE